MDRAWWGSFCFSIVPFFFDAKEQGAGAARVEGQLQGHGRAGKASSLLCCDGGGVLFLVYDRVGCAC